MNVVRWHGDAAALNPRPVQPILRWLRWHSELAFEVVGIGKTVGHPGANKANPSTETAMTCDLPFIIEVAGVNADPAAYLDAIKAIRKGINAATGLARKGSCFGPRTIP